MERITAVILAFLVGSVFVSSLATTVSSTEGTAWTKYADNPLNLGSENVWYHGLSTTDTLSRCGTIA